MKSGSDNIGHFILYGTTSHACQGAGFVGWYREAGLSELEKGVERKVSAINTRYSFMSQEVASGRSARVGVFWL